MSQERAQTLVNQGKQRWTQFAPIAPFLVPGWDANLRNHTESQLPVRQNRKVYDTTGTHAVGVLANGLMSFVTPPEEYWAALSEEGIPERLKKPFQRINSNVTKVLANQFIKSDLYSTLHNMYVDLSTFCTAAIYIGWKKDKLLFERIRPGTYGFEVDYDGDTLEFSRAIDMTVGQIKSFFGMCPPSLAGKGIGQVEEVFHYVSKDPLTNKITGTWFLSSIQDPLKVEEFDIFPYIVTRFATGNTKWGVGPGFYAAPDIMTLNGMEGAMDFLVKKMVDPPKFKTPGARGKLSFAPGAVNTILNQSQIPIELTPQGNPMIGMQRIEMKKENVKEYFYTNLFNMFSNLAQQSSSRRTTSEVAQLEQERRSGFTPVLYSLSRTLLKPLISRSLKLVMTNTNLVEMENEEVRELLVEQDGSLKLESITVDTFIRRALEQRRLQASLGTAEMFQQLGPETQMLIDPKIQCFCRYNAF